ncbi:MAG: amino acid permease [Flavobacteriales bacterium]|nr:amino acid permease [Flavobacteriales bacterium]
MPPDATDGNALHRALGPGHVIFFGVGSILGAGIYTLIGKVAGEAGNLTWLAFLIASFTAFLTAFSYAELSAAFPRSGGEYVYAQKAFGQRAGTGVGLLIALNGVISAATVSLGFAGYFTELVDLPLLPVALGIIGFLLLVNIRGIQASSTVNIVLTVVEILGLVAVGVVAFPHVGSVDLLALPDGKVNGLFFAAALSFFAYMGFEDIVKLAEETRSPERNIPRALFMSNGIVLVVYVTLAMLVVSAMPWQQLADEPAPLAAIVGGRWGRVGLVVVGVAALFSTSNTLLTNLMGSSRVLAFMGRELGPLRWLGRLSPQRTPVAALVLIALIAAAFALIGDIAIVARIATASIFLTFMLVNLSAIVLRIRQPDLVRPYRIPMQIGRVPVIPVLAILFTLLLMGFTIAALVTGPTVVAP